MSKLYDKIKCFMKRSTIRGNSLVTLHDRFRSKNAAEEDEPLQKRERNPVSNDFGINVKDDLANIIDRVTRGVVDGRPWRFLPKNFMNDALLKFSEKHQLRNMESVEGILEETDIDNWGRFFKQPKLLPPKTYVMCFKGGANLWKPPQQLETYRELYENKMVSLSKNVGRNKDAADFALSFHCGKLHGKLPLRIAFLIVSGDYGLTEIIKQMQATKRLVGFVNPHQKKIYNNDKHYAEKLDDDQHLLDVINIMSYFTLIAKEDEEIAVAQENCVISNNQSSRFSNMTVEMSY